MDPLSGRSWRSALTDAARRRAEACFAVARSATFDGERVAAVNRGTAIADAAGLSLDLFDVPGRVRKPRVMGSGNIKPIDFDLGEFEAYWGAFLNSRDPITVDDLEAMISAVAGERFRRRT